MLTRELAGASAKPLILSILATGESYGYAILITEKGKQALEREKKQWLCVDTVLAQLWGLQPRLT